MKDFLRLRAIILPLAILALALPMACGGEGNIFELDVGDCFNFEEAEELADVDFIPCDEPHQREVFAVVSIDVAAGLPYPGSSQVEDVSRNMCLEKFEDFVGADYYDSRLDFEVLFPTRDSWNDIDDREVTCSLYDLEDLYMEGSMEASGI